MMTLSEIAGEITKNRKLSTMCVDDYPPGQRPGWQMKKNQAVEKLEGLEKTYANALQESSVTIVPYGDPDAVASFGEAAVEAGVDLVVNVDSLYTRIVNDVERSIEKTREWTPAVLEQAMRAGQNAASDVGAKELRYDASRAYRNKCLPTRADVLAEVRYAMSVALGPALEKAWITATLTRQAAEKAAAGDAVSVLILGARDRGDAVAYQAAWPSRSATPELVAGQTFTPDSVTKLYNVTRKTDK